MSTRLEPSDPFDRIAGDATSIDQAKQVSAIASAFSDAIPMGPQVLELQRALVAGMAHSQGLEAKRLARRLDKSDPRLTAAIARARVFGEMATTAEAVVTEVTRNAKTAADKPGLQGYVSRADGSPAQRHVVQLALVSDQKQREPLEAETDARGYFSIELGKGALDDYRRAILKKAEATGVDSTGASAAGKASPNKGDTAAPADNANETPVSAVRVLDEKRKAVFRDPLPPTFEKTPAEFRYYVLGMDEVEKASRSARSAL